MATGNICVDSGFACPCPRAKSCARTRARHPPRAATCARARYPRACPRTRQMGKTMVACRAEMASSAAGTAVLGAEIVAYGASTPAVVAPGDVWWCGQHGPSLRGPPSYGELADAPSCDRTPLPPSCVALPCRARRCRGLPERGSGEMVRPSFIRELLGDPASRSASSWNRRGGGPPARKDEE